MSNPRYEIVHGRRILVEDYDGEDVDNVVPIKPASKKRKPSQKFARLELEWAADMAKASGMPGAMVWVLLRYMAWKARSRTFSLSNVLLTKYGINRKVKYRTLARLESAGRIKVDRCGAKKAPIVTLLVEP